MWSRQSTALASLTMELQATSKWAHETTLNFCFQYEGMINLKIFQNPDNQACTEMEPSFRFSTTPHELWPQNFDLLNNDKCLFNWCKRTKILSQDLLPWTYLHIETSMQVWDSNGFVSWCISIKLFCWWRNSISIPVTPINIAFDSGICY